MKSILNLLKLQIDNKTNLLKIKNPKKMTISVLKIILFLSLATAGISFASSKIFILGIKVNAELLGIVLLVTQIISLLFAIGNVINTMYLNKDNDMLICLPVTPNQLFVSKILFIYLKELLVNSMIVIPLFATFGIMGGFGVSYYLSLFAFLFILPILPIVVASIISVLVMTIVRFLSKYTALSIILMLLLVMTCLIVYIVLISNIMDTFNIANDQLDTVRKLNLSIVEIGKGLPIYYRLGMALISFRNWWYMPIFLIVCASLFIITTLIVKPFFFKTAMSIRQSRNDYNRRNGKFLKRSSFVSLMTKEMLCIFRSPSEVFGYFLFTLLMPFIVFSYDKLLMSITVTSAGNNMIAGSHVMVVAILAMLSNIVSASAVSRDGSNFYISKVTPVSYYTQMFAKLAFNVMFTVASVLVTMIVSFFVYPAWQVLLGTVAVIFVSIGHAAMSVDMDIKNPMRTFEGSGKSSTVSKSTTKSIIYALLIGFIVGLVVILMSSFKYAIVPYLIIIVAGLVFMIHRLYLLVLRINLQYDKIEL